MIVFVAKLSVSVALFSAVAPALAGAPVATKVMDGSRSPCAKLAASEDLTKNYWTGRSEYYVAKSGTSLTGATPPRHVLISGWHPTEGFETEVAEEAANRAEHPNH